MIGASRPTPMTARPSPATELAGRVERGLMAAPVHMVARRFGLTEEEMRDLCPDMFDDEAEEEPGDGGY